MQGGSGRSVWSIAWRYHLPPEVHWWRLGKGEEQRVAHEGHPKRLLDKGVEMQLGDVDLGGTSIRDAEWALRMRKPIAGVRLFGLSSILDGEIDVNVLGHS